MKAWELISDKARFCVGNFSVNKENLYVHPNGKDAIKWDLQGALQKCYDFTSYLRLKEAARKIINKERKYIDLAHFNDLAPHREVVDFLKAIENES